MNESNEQPIPLKIIDATYITHDVKRFILEKPKGFQYAPGDTALLSLDRDGWRDQKRPFCFTSINDWPYLEFVIKIYEERGGVTNEMNGMNMGDQFLLHSIFKSFPYKGPGIFIAAGTGITPFIAILRALFLSGNLREIGLIYSNHTAQDIILLPELQKMLGKNFIPFLTREGTIGFNERTIDRKFLIDNIQNFDRRFYICGPNKFVKSIGDMLLSLGAEPSSIYLA